ncbi:MAG: response regulator [Candidatus Heimdallarchaeota archaeon]|nr:response regulator [Candidatus Heimdallarchaeota archaeon]
MYQDIHILFFDDVKFLLKGLQRHFKDTFTCHIATTLDEAEAILAENDIRIIVADHQMPDNIGIKLLESVKENPKIRKIFTTSDRHGELVLSLLNEKIVDAIVYTPLSRPLLKEELIAQVKIIKG